MSKQTFSVNTDAVIGLTAKLERLNKSAFPNSVRNTLNDGAFAMKQGNILASAKKNMTVRNQTFFKKFTGVEKAKGWNINSMQSQVGFINTDKDKKKGQKAMIGMEHNEVGGSDSQGAMYLYESRTSKDRNKLVNRNKRFNKARVTKAKTTKNYKNSFFANAYNAFEKKQSFFMFSKNTKYLVTVKSISRGDNGNANIKLTFLMRSRRNNIAHAKATHFNKEAALKTAKEMDKFYAKNAEREFNKVLKSTS